MPINDSFIGAVTMELSALRRVSTKSRAAGTSPHRLAFKEKSSIHLPGSGLCNARKWRPRNAINQTR
jgi:hypothetical protein